MAAVSKSVVFSNVLEVNAPNGNLDPLSLSVMFDGIVPPESLTFPIVRPIPHCKTNMFNVCARIHSLFKYL